MLTQTITASAGPAAKAFPRPRPDCRTRRPVQRDRDMRVIASEVTYCKDEEICGES